MAAMITMAACLGWANGGAAKSTSAPQSMPTTTSSAKIDMGNGLSLKLVLIPPGKFIMGDPEGADHVGVDRAAYAHEVRITRPFYIGTYVITWQQWQSVLPKAGMWPGPLEKFGKDVLTPKGDRFKDLPAQARYKEAVEFCKKVSLQIGQKVRLATEAEWEYACRAGTATRYFFGTDPKLLNEYAWWDGGSPPRAVGLKKPNPWGLYDVYGNCGELVSDLYGFYSGKKEVDPTGPLPSEKLAFSAGEPCHVRRGFGRDENLCSSARWPILESGGAHVRVVIEWPLVKAEETTGVFKFVSLSQGTHLEMPAYVAKVTSMPSGNSAQVVVPNKPYCEKGPDPVEAVHSVFKAAAEGDLLKVTYSRLPGGPAVAMSAEPYKLKPGEDKPGVYLFSKMSTERIAQIERPVLVVQKYLQESTFVLPVRQVAGRYKPDAEMMTTINGLQEGEAVEVQNDGKTLRSIRPYKPVD